jgi:hypothetical protein
MLAVFRLKKFAAMLGTVHLPAMAQLLIARMSEIRLWPIGARKEPNRVANSVELDPYPV